VGSAAVLNAAAVSSPHGVRVVRSVAAIAGWSATWHPRRGRPTALAVSRAGLVQAVEVPPGSGVVTWSYVPPWFTAGLALSLGATALILLLVVGTVADGTLGGEPAGAPSPGVPPRQSGSGGSAPARALPGRIERMMVVIRAHRREGDQRERWAAGEFEQVGYSTGAPPR
jgi:hypothetical protein